MKNIDGKKLVQLKEEIILLRWHSDLLSKRFTDVRCFYFVCWFYMQPLMVPGQIIGAHGTNSIVDGRNLVTNEKVHQVLADSVAIAARALIHGTTWLCYKNTYSIWLESLKQPN